MPIDPPRPAELALHIAILGKTNPAGMLRYLAFSIYHARTTTGSKILDPSDFKAWLEELAEEIEKQKAVSA